MKNERKYFILIGRSRSGTTITHNILKECEFVDITNQVHRFDEGLIPESNKMIVGDKIETPSLEYLEKLKQNDQFSFIHIIRDGRDSVASGMALRRREPFIRRLLGLSKREWKSLDPRINSAHWARLVRRWQSFRETLPSKRFLELRYEDYIENPGINSEKMAVFLGIEVQELVQIEYRLIQPKVAHWGRYLDIIPNWEDTFDADAIMLLREYGYIT